MFARVAERVVVVEHDDATRQPRSGGQEFSGLITELKGLYVEVTYDDQSLTRTGKDVFYAASGWRAWDGEFRWRLRRSNEDRW